MWNKYVLLLMAVLLVWGCGSKKKATRIQGGQGEVYMNGADAYLINNLDFRTFSGKAKAKVEFDNEKQDVTLHIRILRDREIWISVTATLINFEVARVRITPDSIQILNKMRSEYIGKRFDYIHLYTGTGVSFFTLQDLFMANVSQSLLRTDRVTVASAVDEVQLVGVRDDLSFQYSLNEKNRPKVFRLNAVGGSDYLESFYSNFVILGGYNFPQNQQIRIGAGEMNISAILNYSKADFNQDIEMPFAVPGKYKVIE
ncbi:DUF4292 domain-containing protein [Sphingobacterium faecale]|uniref:DUF4292 domain-containing protein n=1 Tax=Sphingobacterium faecale TaxID=2803775 RepID=A0ABS1R259_9SPHI|nr:DUF4292 domain-containing protein [Sphingobacterium faecale]MBL1407981.1 DUF4292 domain-containing protein [Sphingobacterium faecale]